MLCGLVPINNRHIAVHEYEVIIAFEVVVLLYVLLDKLQSLLSVIGPVAELLDVAEAHREPQYDEQGLDVEGLIVDYHDLALVKHVLPGLIRLLFDLVR